MTAERSRILTEAADSVQQHVRCQTHTEANGKANAVDHLRQLAAEALPATGNPSVITDRVLSEVLAERIRQDDRWGEQNHPDGSGLPVYRSSAYRYRNVAERNAADGVLAWRDVLLEEVYEALAEADPALLRAELVQIAAVAVAWAEAIDRRAAVAPAAAEEVTR